MRARGFGAAAIVLIAATIALVSAPALGADPVQIIDVDTAPRAGGPGANATFEWTVRNLDTLAYDVSIAVAPVDGWTATVSPALIPALAPNRAASVRLTVQAPPQVAAVFLVRFEVDDSGAVVFVGSRNAPVSVPSALAEKRVVGLFENPLPEPLDNEWGVFLLDVLIWLRGAVLPPFLFGPVAKRFPLKTKTQL